MVCGSSGSGKSSLLRLLTRLYQLTTGNIFINNKNQNQISIEEYRKIDPITQVLDVIMEQKYATEEEIEAIDEKVKDLVEECVAFAEASPFPEVQQLYDVVYEQENYPFIPHKL